MSEDNDLNKDAVGPAKAVTPTIGSLRDRIDRLFDDFGRDFTSWGRSFGDVEPFKGWSSELNTKLPAVDVIEQKDQYLIKAELPGIEEDDLDIDLSEGILTVKGEKKREEDREEDNVHISERTYGSFRRSFRLPPDADADNIKATCKDGVVEVTIPRSELEQPEARKIEITTK